MIAKAPQTITYALLACFALANPASAQMEFSLEETEDKKSEDKGDVFEELAGSAGDIAVESQASGIEDVEEIYAVQQIYALRLKRFELSPSAAFNVNDPFIRQHGLGLGVNYWWTNVLAVGLNLVWYDFLSTKETDLGNRIKRASKAVTPLNQWQMGLHANFTYVPFYGKFTMFNKFIFQWDAYIVGGVGFMRTKPIPIIDKVNREFGWGTRAAFNAGLGLRIFFTRYLSFFTEFRNYMFLEREENTRVDELNPQDRSKWEADSPNFFNASTIHIGLSIFFPFKVEYRLPK